MNRLVISPLARPYYPVFPNRRCSLYPLKHPVQRNEVVKVVQSSSLFHPYLVNRVPVDGIHLDVAVAVVRRQIVRVPWPVAN